MPRRINQRQIRRPKDVAEVKPKQTSGNQAPVEEGKIKNLAVLRAKPLLDPNGHNCCNNSEREKWHERKNIALQSQRSAFPPEHDQQHCRQCDNRSLGHQAKREESEGNAVRLASSIFIVA